MTSNSKKKLIPIKYETYADKLKRKNQIKIELSLMINDLIDIVLSFDEYYSYEDAIFELELHDHKLDKKYNVDEKTYTVTHPRHSVVICTDLRTAYLHSIKSDIKDICGRYQTRMNKSLQSLHDTLMNYVHNHDFSLKHLIFPMMKFLERSKPYRLMQTDEKSNRYFDEDAVYEGYSKYRIIGPGYSSSVYPSVEFSACKNTVKFLSLQYQINPLRHKLQHMSKFIRVIIQIKKKYTEDQMNYWYKCERCGGGFNLRCYRTKTIYICKCDLSSIG